MVNINIISATGRLKNKIDFSYSVSVNAGEVIADSGIIYSTDLATVTSGTIRAISYSGTGTFSKTFIDVPNGAYYAVAYAYNSTVASNVYSTPTQITISDAGYELSTDGILIANPLVISNGSEGVDRVLTSDSSGLSKWKSVRSLFNFGHYIGELYGGGIVVDVWKEGDDEKVLIASLEDLKSTNGFYNATGSTPTQWIYGGAMSTTLLGSSAQSLYNGKSNTDYIVKSSNLSGATGSAAQICVDYRGGGYDDWYLPAYYELNTIYNQAGIVNKVLSYDSITNNFGYWTSTEAQSNRAYMLVSLGYLAYNLKNKNYFDGTAPSIRAVRRESIYTGDGLCLNLDTTNVKSFSDSNYMLLGTSSKWVDLVNAGMTSSYSFNLSSYPTVSSGGSSSSILPTVSSINGPGVTYSGNSYRDPLGGFVYDNWYLTNITNSVVSVPRLYNNGGTSSFVSKYFSVSYTDTNIQFQTSDASSVANSFGATVNVYISTIVNGYTSPYNIIKQISGTTASISNIKIPLYSYHGKTISIKITAPNASYTSVSSYAGPTLDEISVLGTVGGYQATGPVYFPDESGFMRFNGTGSSVDSFNTFGSYIDFKAPIGTSSTVTVEMWARIKRKYDASGMLFGWNIYDVLFDTTSRLGFNTGNGDIYGISGTTSTNLMLLDNWTHYVFEMNNASYVNNKIYINGNEQILSAQAGIEIPSNTNFNGGVGRIGGWKSANDYLFNGDISAFRVYNRPLSKDEIMKNYNTERKRYEILPIAMKNKLKMSFDANLSYSGTGTVITELSGSHSNGSIVTSSGYISPTYSISNTLYPGKYFTFNGNNTKIEYAQIVLSENMSWEAWFRCTGTVSSPNPIVSGSFNMFMGQVLPYFGFTNNKIIFSNYINNTQTYLISSSNLLLNKWYHVVGTTETVSNKTLSKIYINGVRSVESYATGTQSKWFGSNYNFAIGDGQGTDRPTDGMTQWYPFKGDVGQVRVYYKTLSYEEVKNNYNTSKHIFEDDYSEANKFYSHELNSSPTFSISQNFTLDINGKANDKILRSDADGKTSWVDKNYFFTKPNNYRYIGEFYGGGIIVAMWKYPSNLFNYLIMSLEDLSTSSTWSNVVSTTSNATSEHNGISNTNTIISQATHTTSAAKLCNDYVSSGFTDWYLPSITELNQAFNAAQAVDTVLASDSLKETYWSSTESGSSTAYAYEFKDSISQIGYIRDDVSKGETASVRAFRHAKVYDVIHNWQDEWPAEYTPFWSSPYTWDESNWSFTTSIIIDTNPIKQSINQIYPGIFSFTFSNTITTNETIINTGICWATSSTTPTVANSFTYSQSGGPTIFNTKTPNITGPVGGTFGQTNYVPNILFFRSFVTTSSGIYYSSNGNYPNGGTYLAAGSINKTYPANSYVAILQTLYE